MKEPIDSSIIKNLLFSAYDQFGPTPKYTYPKAIPDNEDKSKTEVGLSTRDYTQISIKNLSLLLDDQAILKEKPENLSYFAILPYPDFKLTSLCFFHFVNISTSKKPVATAFAIMVDENKRSFLYNNIDSLKSLTLDFFTRFDEVNADGFKSDEEIEPYFNELLEQIIEIEKNPSTPTTTHRKLKIIFLGLDDSGKTSFLLSVDRKFSKLIGLKPTRGAQISTIEALGATISLWDLGGQRVFREKYLSKSQIYLYEADLLYYFIDINNKDRFEESIEYLQNIRSIIHGFDQNTPIIYVLTKGDDDIIDTRRIKKNIKFIKSRLAEITGDTELDTHVTSIFSIFSVLRAFSSGISKLSPNRDLINYNLKNFSKDTNVFLTLLLSNDGLVIADFYAPGSLYLTELIEKEQLKSDEMIVRDVFEITAPQFAMLFKIFSKFKALQKDEALFKIANSVILIRKIAVSDYDMFALYLMDDESKKERINELLPDFINRTKELLLRFIS
jgi:GTPase SAR1 family protein